MSIPVLYEDAELLAVDKPAGVASIPQRGRAGDDLATRLNIQQGCRLWVVHRLDKAVSGVILFAKDAETHRWLNSEFAGRRVEKHYRALVHGCLDREHGSIDVPLRAFGSGRMGVDLQRGKASCTMYERHQIAADYSLVSAYPVTGRRHQIRVHLYHIGHPIVGDPRYGDPVRQAAYPRLMLHARRIALTTRGGNSLTVESPLPPSFLTCLASLGIHSCDS